MVGGGGASGWINTNRRSRQQKYKSRPSRTVDHFVAVVTCMAFAVTTCCGGDYRATRCLEDY